MLRSFVTAFRNNHGVAVLAIVLLALLCYGNSFHVPFVFDDFHNIAENPYLKLQNLSMDKLVAAATNSQISQRWLANLSFAVNYYFFGQDVRGYHLINLFIHILTGITVYLLFRITLRQQVPARITKHPDEIALAAALLWLVHPLATNSVTYIVQRMTSMAALFEVTSLLCYVYGRLAPGHSGRQYGFFAACLFLGFLALGCKENAAMLPLMILAYDFFWLGQSHRPGRPRRLALGLALAVLLLLLLAWIYYGTNPLSAILAGYDDRNFTLGQRLLTQPRVIFFYLGLLILPLPGFLNINHDFPVSLTLWSPATTFPAILGLASLVALIAYFFNRHRLLAFALFWFLSNLVIESSVVPLEIVFEHRLYLPSIFLFLGAAVLLDQGLRAQGRLATRIALAILIALLSLGTWQRNTVWATSVSLWSDVVKKSPRLMRGHNNLGKALLHEGRFAEAERVLRTAIDLDPESSYAYTNLAVVYEKQNRLDEALTLSRLALAKKDHDPVKIHHNLGIVYFKLRDHQKALDELNIALSLAPDYADAYVTLGAVFGKSGNHQKAEELILKAIELDPGNGYAYQNLGSALERQNRLDEAKMAFEQALTLPNIDPLKIHNNLCIVYGRLADYQRSISHAQAAIALDPDFVDTYLNLAITYEDMGNRQEALVQYREAFKRGYPMIGAYQAWARQLLAAGKTDQAIAYLKEAISLAPDQAADSRALLGQTLARQATAPRAGDRTPQPPGGLNPTP